VILELKGKVTPFLSAAEIQGLDAAAAGPAASSSSEEAVATLVALGETRMDAERMVRTALTRNRALTTPDQIVAAAYGG
jgi:Holliday junction resolvasome RuvABC DNA-binding subunit